MTAAVSVMNHPTDQTLAAFVDATLNAAEREEVIRHLVECAECRDNVLLTGEIVAAEAAGKGGDVVLLSNSAPAAKASGEGTDVMLPPNTIPAAEALGNVARPRFGRTPWVALGSAAAAIVVVVLAVPSVRERVFGPGTRSTVVAALQSQEKRQTESRLSWDLQYKEPRPRNRGGREEEARLSALVALSKASESVEDNATPENRHLLGIAFLLNGKRNEAVEQLELAARAAPSATVLNDLAAAYLERSREGDYQRALDLANRALKLEQNPVGMWNRALALERLERHDEAIAAWKQYITVETSPEWITEARARVVGIREIRDLLRPR